MAGYINDASYQEGDEDKDTVEQDPEDRDAVEQDPEDKKDSNVAIYHPSVKYSRNTNVGEYDLLVARATKDIHIAEELYQYCGTKY
ncbi:unnamed protein product [Agarophyton chilense]